MPQRGFLYQSDDILVRIGSGRGNNRRKPRTPFLAWTIALTIMISLATGSWIFSLYVFGHPEQPFNYKLLNRLDQLDSPKQFQIYDVPIGKAFDAKQLYAKYHPFLNESQDKSQTLNRRLHREYLTNYRKADPVDYASGKFRIINVHQLSANDVFTSGIAIRAQAVDTQDLLIEYIFPADSIDNSFFRKGDELTIEGNTAFAAVLNFEKIDDRRMCLTLIPLVYGRYTAPDGTAIALKPPSKLNLRGGWPVTSNQPSAPTQHQATSNSTENDTPNPNEHNVALSQ